MSRDALFSSFKAQPFGSGGFDRYAVYIDSEGVGDVLAHLWNVWCHFGALRHYGAINIAHSVASFFQQFTHMLQQFDAGDAFETGVGIGEMLPDVSQSSGSQ